MREKYCFATTPNPTSSPTPNPTPTPASTPDPTTEPSMTTKITPTISAKRRVKNETKARYKQGLNPDPINEIEEKLAIEKMTKNFLEDPLAWSFENLTQGIEEGSGGFPKRRRRQNPSPANKWDVIGQFGVFYDDEEYENENEEEAAVVEETEEIPALSKIARNPPEAISKNGGFVWGDWHDDSEKSDTKVSFFLFRFLESIFEIQWSPPA